MYLASHRGKTGIILRRGEHGTEKASYHGGIEGGRIGHGRAGSFGRFDTPTELGHSLVFRERESPGLPARCRRLETRQPDLAGGNRNRESPPGVDHVSRALSRQCAGLQADLGNQERDRRPGSQQSQLRQTTRGQNRQNSRPQARASPGRSSDGYQETVYKPDQHRLRGRHCFERSHWRFLPRGVARHGGHPSETAGRVLCNRSGAHHRFPGNPNRRERRDRKLWRSFRTVSIHRGKD